MGMDLIGISPTKKCGEYFRANIWWWSPLWEYCDQVAPEICEQVKHAYSNDGDGLDDEDSKALATVLLKEHKQGNTKKYQDERDTKIKALSEGSWGTHYGFDADFVKEFASFLRYCGGFNIW